MSTLRITFRFLVATLLGGCATDPPFAPHLSEVCVSGAGPDCINVAFAGATTGVAFLGKHFHWLFEVDIDNEDRPVPLGRFHATIGGTQVEQLYLAPGLLRDLQVLVGVLPGTLEVGNYDAEITAPSGESSTLPGAFVIVDPFDVRAEREEPQIPVGMHVPVEVTLLNLGPKPLTEVSISFSQAGDGRFLLPPDPAGFAIGRESSLSVHFYPQATSEGPVSLLLTASALANGEVRVGPEQAVVVEFLVLAPADLVVTAEMDPSAVAAGERFVLVVDVANDGGTPAVDVRVLPPWTAGSGSLTLDTPPPEPQTILQATRRRFRWSGTAGQPGSVTLTVLVEGEEAVSGRSLGPLTADPVAFEIL